MITRTHCPSETIHMISTAPKQLTLKSTTLERPTFRTIALNVYLQWDVVSNAVTIDPAIFPEESYVRPSKILITLRLNKRTGRETFVGLTIIPSEDEWYIINV